MMVNISTSDEHDFLDILSRTLNAISPTGGSKAGKKYAAITGVTMVRWRLVPSIVYPYSFKQDEEA